MPARPAKIDLIIPSAGTRQWHVALVERLRAQGHRIRIVFGQSPKKSRVLEMVLALEKHILRANMTALAHFADMDALRPDEIDQPDFTLDLTTETTAAGTTEHDNMNALHLGFPQSASLNELAAQIAQGELPDIAIYRGGKPIATARPMIDNRVMVTRALDDVLARAISLILATLKRLQAGDPFPPAQPMSRATAPSLAGTYLTKMLPRLLREIDRRRTDHFAHWRVGYRFTADGGVAQSGNLSGESWHVLPDDGSRFYADPFAVEHEGRHFIFVEDYPHATGKAVISMVEIDKNGMPTDPQVVLEENWHLSYPQVFKHDGEIWMLPEASAGEGLRLYRATEFPFKWVRHKTLIAKSGLSDATLIEREGRLWLVGTDRDGAGSTSDLMVVYWAETLLGPWTAHRANPILIDRARARPGGAFIAQNGAIYLPVQDGTTGYGGGLGIAKLESLTENEVTFAPPVPIVADGDFPYPRIHTLNRAGGLEVVDGIAAVKKSRV